MVEPLCKTFQSEQACNQLSDCFWLQECRAKKELVQFLHVSRAKSQPEMENENESEFEIQNSGIQINPMPNLVPQGASPLGCAALNQNFCAIYASSCEWTVMGCVPKQLSPIPSLVPEHEFEYEGPGVPSTKYDFQGQTIPGVSFEHESESENESQMQYNGAGVSASINPAIQYERESETETQIGTSQTYEYQRESNIPGGVGYQHVIMDTGLQPAVNSYPPADRGLPAVPVSPGYDNSNHQLKCLSLKDEEQCAAFLICQWDPREICVPKNFPVATQPPRPQTCDTIKEMIECVDANGCQWNIPTQSCKEFRNVMLQRAHTCSGIARESCSSFFGCEWDTERLICSNEHPVEVPHSEVSEISPTEPEQPAMYCLQMSMSECDTSALCFWDARMICLPTAMQQETTKKASTGMDRFFHPMTQQGNPDPSFHSPVSNAPNNGLNSPSSPGQEITVDGGNVSPLDVESESESEGESELVATTNAINSCFYHPDRQTCLRDNGCFWDRKTHLCASLEVPNFLPATCEGFIYEAPCTLDERCVWKSGECEDANLDCEDMTTKDLCLRTKYNGFPCVWSDHEMECDEAPIVLQKEARREITHKQAEFFFLWPVLIIIPFALVVFAICRKISSIDIHQQKLLEDCVLPSHAV